MWPVVSGRPCITSFQKSKKIVMEQSVNEAWKRLLDEARRELPEATVRTWLEPSEPIALDDGRLILGAPDQFAAEWNESKHASLLARVAERVLGRPTTVVFRVQEDRQRRPQMDFFVAPRESSGVAAATNVGTTLLNERYTFQTFVIGKSNELAAAAAHAIAEAPGKTYNPLFIYGATGLGKTHLMQAIAHAVLERNPGTRLQYFGAEQFINDVIESIHARTMPEFRRRYRNDVDLLLVDDVHFLEGKEMTQEEFFHTFNALFEAHKQIVLTSDRPPKEIPGLEDRLISRFEWGMVADIGHPDLEHRIAILRKKADPVLEIGMSDVGDHAPFEPRDQPVLQPGNFLGRPVRGQHDLLVRLEQRVEGVEELLLRHFLAFQEMHVVHEEQIHVVAVAAPELGHRARVNRLDHVVDELFRPEVLQPGLRVFLEHRVCDGLHQVRLAEPRRAVDKE